jgi:hypothetical protein
MDKLKIMLSFLRELNDGNIPKAQDYGIKDEDFYDIVDACQDAGYIKGARFPRGQGNHILTGFLQDTKLTVSGMEYLHENSALMKTYKGLKEIRQWLPW